MNSNVFSLLLGLFWVFLIPGCADTDVPPTSTTRSAKIDNVGPATVDVKKNTEVVLIRYVETEVDSNADESEGVQKPASRIWEVRQQSDWLKLYQGQKFIHQVKKGDWYKRAFSMLDIDTLKKFEGKRVALENEKSFWLEVKERGLTSFADSEVATQKIEDAEDKRTDLLAGITYNKLLRRQAAYNTLKGALADQKLLSFESSSGRQQADLVVLLFDPFKS